MLSYFCGPTGAVPPLEARLIASMFASAHPKAGLYPPAAPFANTDRLPAGLPPSAGVCYPPFGGPVYYPPLPPAVRHQLHQHQQQSFANALKDKAFALDRMYCANDVISNCDVSDKRHLMTSPPCSDSFSHQQRGKTTCKYKMLSFVIYLHGK